MTERFPFQRVCDTECVAMPWRHHNNKHDDDDDDGAFGFRHWKPF